MPPKNKRKPVRKQIAKSSIARPTKQVSKQPDFLRLEYGEGKQSLAHVCIMSPDTGMYSVIQDMDALKGHFSFIQLSEGRYSQSGGSRYRVLRQIIQGEVIENGETMTCQPY
jgi:hypothetical protein